MVSYQAFALEDYVHLTLAGIDVDPQAVQQAGAKRDAMVFPMTSDLPQGHLQSDDNSTWEFQATTPSLTCSNGSYESRRISAAQDIAMRYRLGLPMDGSDISSGSCEWSIISEVVQGDSRGSLRFEHRNDSEAPKVATNDLESTVGCEIRRDDSWSRLEAALYNESYAVMYACEAGEEDPLVCQRPDCGNTVKTVKALMTHLHIHDLHDEISSAETTAFRDLRKKLTSFTPLITTEPSSPPLSPYRSRCPASLQN